MANVKGYVDARHVITGAAQTVGDPQGDIVGMPRYYSFMADGLRELAYDAPWDTKTYDIAIPDSRIVTDLPEYITGINNIYLYQPASSGNNGGTGSPGGMLTVPVHLKDNFFHDGGPGYFANNKWWNFPDGTQMSIGYYEPWNLYYAGWRNGKLYLSPQCAQFTRLRLDYTGVGFERFCPGEPMKVPVWAMDALRYYVARRACEHLVHIEGKSSNAWRQLAMFEKQMDDYNGAWNTALMRWAQADAKDRSDIVLYTSYMGYVPF